MLALRRSQLRLQGLFPGFGKVREKTLASSGHVSILHPEILGVINKRVSITKSAKITMAEKLSALFVLDLPLIVVTFRRFV